MKLARVIICAAMTLQMLHTSMACAAERELSFLSIPADRMSLVRKLILSDSITSDESKEWDLAIKRDIKIADLSLNESKNSQIALFISNKNYCSHYGCTLQIWEFKNGEWTEILSTIAEKLSIQDKTDNGYHRLIEHRPIYTGEKWIERKPFQYIWNGNKYDSDSDENG